MSARTPSFPAMETRAALALLDWQIELGADEAICESPVNRYELKPLSAVQPERSAPKAQAGPHAAVAKIDAVAEAEAMAAQATSMADLQASLAAFDHCELKKGARNLVFSDGKATARVMIIGEAPGRDEDLQGRPFVGPAGQLLDQMLDAIGLSRDAAEDAQAVYITNILPWRPPENRNPTPEEIAMMMPFVRRHVQLAAPDVLVAMGNISCQGLLGRKGITRMRGTWESALDRPVMPMFHPAYLLRSPHEKRKAWHDLLALQARLRGLS